MPRTLPEWYRRKDWKEATIDLTEFGFGEVVLKDASFDQVNDWLSSRGKLDEMKSLAKMFAAYVRMGTDPTMPVERSKWHQWEEWLKSGIPNKVIVRITRGIRMFTEQEDEEADEAPNS